jgi:hypothetical protein
MNRQQLIAEIKDKRYFKIQELVCRHVFDQYGEQAWRFLTTEFLHTLLVIRRDILQKPMVCNNWHNSGSFSQRGLRCNLCQIVSNYTKKNQLTTMPHVVGAGGDFTVSGMTAQESRTKITAGAGKLPCPIRLEDVVTWLHFDVHDIGSEQKVTFFKP